MPKTKSRNKLGKTRVIFACFILILITLSLFNFSLFIYSKPKVILAKNDFTEEKILFWRSFLATHPTYFEGWIQLAKLTIKKGDKNTAETAFLKAWKIDPNSEKLSEIQKGLQNY